MRKFSLYSAILAVATPLVVGAPAFSQVVVPDWSKSYPDWMGQFRLNPIRPHTPHHHPPQDEGLHATFYSNWIRKDTKTTCCNNRDCYPTAAKFDKATRLWWAQRREDGKWLPIPKKVYDNDNPDEVQSPDGRPHLCAPKPGTLLGYGQNFVYCFTPGIGT